MISSLNPAIYLNSCLFDPEIGHSNHSYTLTKSLNIFLDWCDFSNFLIFQVRRPWFFLKWKWWWYWHRVTSFLWYSSWYGFWYWFYSSHSKHYKQHNFYMAGAPWFVVDLDPWYCMNLLHSSRFYQISTVKKSHYPRKASWKRLMGL